MSKQSGYSLPVFIAGAQPMSERWKARRGWRHRLLMLWPPYRRAEARREWLRYLHASSRGAASRPAASKEAEK